MGRVIHKVEGWGEIPVRMTAMVVDGGRVDSEALTLCHVITARSEEAGAEVIASVGKIW